MSKFDEIISNDQPVNGLEFVDSQVVEAATIKRRSVMGAIAYVFRTFAIQIIAILANIALSIFLGPKEYGVYYLVVALIGLFTFLSDIGLAATLVQKKDEPTKQDLRTTFTVQLGLAVLIVIILIALTPYWQLTQGFGRAELALLYAMALSFVMTSLRTIPSILLERELRFDLVIIPALVENLVFYSLVVFLAWQGWGISSYTAAVLVRGVAGVIVTYSIKRWPIGFALDRRSLKSLLGFGVKFQANDLLARIKDDLFIVFLGWWLGREQLGYVGWAKRWSTYPYQLTVQSVLSVTFPTFSRIQSDQNLLKKAIEKSIYFISLMALPMLAGIAGFIFPLLALLPQFAKWQPAAFSLALFALQISFSSISTPLTNTLMAIGQINKNLWLMTFWTILTWTITPLCIWQFGFNGVAIASFAIGLTSIIPAYFVKKAVPSVTFWPHLKWQTLGAVLILLIGWLGREFWSQSLWWLLSGMFLSVLTYAIIVIGAGWRRFKNEVQSLGVIPKWQN